MCGIAGVSRAPTTSIPDLREFAVNASLAIEHRGPQATGFGWTNRSGHPWYWKSAGRARDVAPNADLPAGMRTLIVHTRYGTHGSTADEVNNHPVVVPGLILVHNGVLSNDRELFDQLGVARQGKVDTEALAALLAYGPAVFGEPVPELLHRVEGDAAIAWLDADTPDVLHLARLAGRPLTIGWTRRGDLVMSSTPETLADTGRLARVRIDDVTSIAEGTYLTVHSGQIVERQTFVPNRRRRSWSPRYSDAATTGHRPTLPGMSPAVREAVKGNGKANRAKIGSAARNIDRIVSDAGHDGLIVSLSAWRAEADRRRKATDLEAQLAASLRERQEADDTAWWDAYDRDEDPRGADDVAATADRDPWEGACVPESWRRK